MSAEGQTIREALDELCHVCAENPRVGRVPEHVAALEARLAEAERALREIISLMPPGEVNGRAYSDARDIAEEYITTGRVQE